MQKIIVRSLIVIFLFSQILGISGSRSKIHFVSAEETSYDGLIDISRVGFDSLGNIFVLGQTEKEDIYFGKFDPNGTVIWDDLFGGSGVEVAENYVFDSVGNVYVVGFTDSSDFQITDNAFQKTFGGMSDFFLRKWDPDGNLVWSTFIGGSDIETSFRIRDVDPIHILKNNDLIIYGWTNSIDFPLKNEFQSILRGNPNELGIPGVTTDGDMFIMKVTSSGDLLWSSYFGSSGIDWADILFDSDENIILSGVDPVGDITDSIKEGFEFAGVRDPYVVKINQDGELVYSFYYGGSGFDVSFDSKIDSENNLIVLLITRSDDFPTQAAIQQNRQGSSDLALTKFDPNGNIIWSTYFGGSNNDVVNFCCSLVDPTGIIDEPRLLIDSEDNIVFLTKTNSMDVSLNHPIVKSRSDSSTAPFVGKIASNGTLIFGSYFNGTIIDAVLSESNDIFITGNVVFPNWAVTANAPQPEHNGILDVTYTIVHSNSSIIQSSYLGGSGTDRLVKSYFTSTGNYLILGKTDSADLPEALNLYEGGEDVFLCQIDSQGNNDWCYYAGGSAGEQVNGAGIIGGPNGEILLIGTTSSADVLNNQDIPSFTETGFMVKLDATGQETWKKIVLPESRNQPQEPPKKLFPTVITILIIAGLASGISYLRILNLKSKKIDELLLNNKMTEILSPIFQSKPQLIHIFGASKVFPDRKTRDEIVADIPTEIMDFRYFFHPIRLSIVKLLDDNMHLTTIQIKEALAINWNELTSHIESLKKRGYISVNQEFIDGITRTVVSAESKVISSYYSLREILLKFLDATPNLDKYLDHVTDVKMRSDDPDLYPNGHV